MRGSRPSLVAAAVVMATMLLAPRAALPHPLGNFSISRYSAIRVAAEAIELRYIVDMAEIPTFQEIQETGLVAEAGHPSVAPYATRKAEALKDGLRLEVNGRVLALESGTRDVIFPPGAGGLPTLKIGIVYRARLDPPPAGAVALHYTDANYRDRAGWKEIVAVRGRGVTLTDSSVPERDRSHQLTDYPTDLLNSPPQTVEARVTFTGEGAPSAAAATPAPPRPTVQAPPPARARVQDAPIAPGSERASTRGSADDGRTALAPAAESSAPASVGGERIALAANRQLIPRSSFTELVATKQLGVGIVLLALAVAAGLGAFHALEPGHGKTVVAAYLVGSRGTARHALWLGLIVTASHTAGVYVLGAVTLYASRYILPERLYPWLGVASGLAIAGLGMALFLRRYAGAHGGHAHRHDHHHHEGGDDHHHPHHHGDPHGHAHGHGGDVSLKALFALGVTGGIVPCPAALVVLLSALSLGRVGFGLVLIAAFSVGLAAVLIFIGLLMVYARRSMARFQGEGTVVTRWLPLTSSAVIAMLGVAIAVQALLAAGILPIRLS